MPDAPRLRILYCEPFATGSHEAFTRSLTAGLDADFTVLTLPGRSWKWRMRGAAAWFALEERAALDRPHDLLFASSFLPLHELLGLAPHLAGIPSILYFHENQLAYPVRPEFAGERDFHFGFSQLLAATVATVPVFNSRHNRDSFCTEAARLLARLPDHVPRGLVEQVRRQSLVLPLPLDLDALPPGDLGDLPPGPGRAAGPLILWNHRWEHDKDPDAFFRVLARLQQEGVPFRVAVCGEQFAEKPPVFARARPELGARVVHWGHLPDRQAYARLLGQAQLALSTAQHEFFGIAVLEATHCGARPLVPDRLAYPEHFPPALRYADEADLLRQLGDLCRAWTAGDLDLRADRRELTAPYARDHVLPRYQELCQRLATRPPRT
ncbi:MAG: DUF3524 domain-containing protein [Myxococcota bacterium]|jgi:glycosyltransferase involved in cell wall biosynthesis|nr:DUF3524 domain-containing protein [Myxococcota bacterium]